MQSQLEARSLYASTRNDPQFQVPTHPCFSPGVATTWWGQTLVIEGVERRRILRGRTAMEVLPRILRMLDGTRTVQQISHESGISPTIIEPTLSLLYSCGVLYQGPVPGETPDALQLLLGRLLDTTRANRNPTDALERLRAGCVLISGALTELGPLLTSCGVTVGSLTDYHPGQRGIRLLVVTHQELRSQQVHSAYRERIPVLPLGVVSAGELVVGPTIEHDYGPCPDCAHDPRNQHHGGCIAGAHRAQVAAEILGLLSRVGHPLTVRGRARVTAEGTVTEQVLRRPDCPVCTVAELPAGTPASSFVRYEQLVEFPPQRLVNPKDHQHHFELGNLALQSEFPFTRAGADDIALDGHDAGPSPDGRTTIDDLAHVLRLSCGLKTTPTTGTKVHRWAPTGGNLGSVASLIESVRIDGIPDGIYGYDPCNDSLRQLQTLGDGPDRHTHLRVLLVGDLHKVARKYQAFALRVVLLDAGVATAFASIAATHRNMQLTIMNPNDPALVRLRATDHPFRATLGYRLDKRN